MSEIWSRRNRENEWSGARGREAERADKREIDQMRGRNLLSAYNEVLGEAPREREARANSVEEPDEVAESLAELERVAREVDGLDMTAGERLIEQAERRERELADEIYDRVDYAAVEREVRRYTTRMTVRDLEKLFGGKEYLEGEEERKRLDRRMVAYLTEVLDLDEMPEVKYVVRPDLTASAKMATAKNTGKNKIMINRAIVTGEDVRESFRVIAHEMMHVHQREMSQKRKMGRRRSGLSEQEWRRAELYRVNFAEGNYINPKDDWIGYRKQLIEVEARAFAEACAEKYDRQLETYEKPLDRLGRRLLGLMGQEGGRNGGLQEG